jgi:plasmid stabilization system protein ParE
MTAGPGFRIIIQPIVRRDTLDIVGRLVLQSPQAADRIVDCIEATIESLCKMPRRNRRVHAKRRPLAEIRRVIVRGLPNYLFLYEVRARTAVVLRVRPSARRWPAGYRLA